MAVVSISMPAPLVERIDDIVDDHGYSGRSELLREASRGLLPDLEAETDPDRTVAGTVTVLCRDDPSGWLSPIETEFDDLISESVTNRFASDRRVALFVLRGPSRDVTALVERLRSEWNPLSVDHSVTPLDTPSPFE